MTAIEMLDLIDSLAKVQNLLRRDIDAIQRACMHEKYEAHPHYLKIRPEAPVQRCCACGIIQLAA